MLRTLTRFLEMAVLHRHSPVSMSHLQMVLSREPVHSCEASTITMSLCKKGGQKQNLDNHWKQEAAFPHLGSQLVQLQPSHVLGSVGLALSSQTIPTSWLSCHGMHWRICLIQRHRQPTQNSVEKKVLIIWSGKLHGKISTASLQ